MDEREHRGEAANRGHWNGLRLDDGMIFHGCIPGVLSIYPDVRRLRTSPRTVKEEAQEWPHELLLQLIPMRRKTHKVSDGYHSS